VKQGLLAAGGVMSAVAASTCCIVPLALVSAGVSGAWIGSLTALAPYQPLFIALAVACLGAGFWLAYRPAPETCQSGACAGSSAPRRSWVKAILWLGAILVALSAGIDYGARLFT